MLLKEVKELSLEDLECGQPICKKPECLVTLKQVKQYKLKADMQFILNLVKKCVRGLIGRKPEGDCHVTSFLAKTALGNAFQPEKRFRYAYPRNNATLAYGSFATTYGAVVRY